MATFATTKQSVLDRINTLASSSSTTAEESIYLAKALRDAAQDITFVWRGPWQATYAYVVGDVAQYDGNAYYCINAHTAGTSFSSGSGSWQTMVVGGTKFWSGSSAPTGAEDGDLFLDTDDEKLYHQVSGSWSLVVDLGGNIWTSGTTVPANSSGEDGDFFLKTDDEKLYQRESGAWTFKVDLGGSRWTSSAAAPSNSNGEQGDVHFDTATQKIYEKGASAWSELADLTPLQADWNGTGLAAILNKPTFKTIGGSNIVGSGDIAVVPADGSITDAKISGMSSSKLSGALPAIDGSALTGIATGGTILNAVFTQDWGSWTGWLTGAVWTNTGRGFNYTYTSASSYLIVLASVMMVKAENNGYWVYSRFVSDRSPGWEIDEQMEHRSTNTYAARQHNWIDTTAHSVGDVVTYTLEGGSNGGTRWGLRSEGSRGQNYIILEVSS